MRTREVGRVAGLWRYPVKSMAAEPLDEVNVSWHGLAGDRRWAFIREGMERSGFPWLTIRERADMASYRPSFSSPDQPDRSPTIVHTPRGAELDVVDPALALELGHGARVIRHDMGVFDTSPLSLVTTQSVTALEGLVGAELDVRRFRPNLLVEATDGTPFAEDGWVGGVLRIGSMHMRVDQRDQRCVMVNIDPVSSAREPAVLRAIGREREACFGVYGSIVRPGRVTRGDAVMLEMD
ncbi:MAG: MOSC domain-containing protein [Gemmatimonadaceae bacterium]